MRLKARLRELLPPCRFEAVLAGSWSVRALWAAAVWAIGITALPLGLLQFVVAPLSFAVCLMRFGTNCFDAILHYMINLVVGMSLRHWMPAAMPAAMMRESTTPFISLGTTFAIAFFAVDFLLNLIVYWQASETLAPAACSSTSATALNTKTVPCRIRLPVRSAHRPCGVRPYGVVHPACCALRV